ncbi:BlaI/MecI/CopY family transcriptional regulator [Patescibacteria group bacterium]|nr:BlaI/MecI/CopY family transcriptional regulator [Patescibacteria group bacterium]
MESLLLTLQQYGLSEKEAKVYLTTLQLGSAPGSSIARNSQENRATVYTILKELQKKGIVNEVRKGNMTYFSVVAPELLLRELEDKYNTFKEKIPEFLAMAEKFGNKPKIQFFEGIEGVKKMYEDLLSSQTEILSFLGIEQSNKDLLYYLNREFLVKRIKNDIHAKVILSDTPANQRYAGIDEKAKKQSILIKKSGFMIEGEINIYGPNKISIALMNDNEMSGLIISSEQLYTTCKNIFDLVRMQNK